MKGYRRGHDEQLAPRRPGRNVARRVSCRWNSGDNSVRAGSSALQQRGNGEPRVVQHSTIKQHRAAGRHHIARRPARSALSRRYGLLAYAVRGGVGAQRARRRTLLVMSALSLAIGIAVAVGLVTFVSRGTPLRAKLVGSLPVGQAQYPVPTNAIFVAPNGDDAASGTRTGPLRTVSAAIAKARRRGDHRAARRHVPRVGHYPAGQELASLSRHIRANGSGSTAQRWSPAGPRLAAPGSTAGGRRTSITAHRSRTVTTRVDSLTRPTRWRPGPTRCSSTAPG